MFNKLITGGGRLFRFRNVTAFTCGLGAVFTLFVIFTLPIKYQYGLWLVFFILAPVFFVLARQILQENFPQGITNMILGIFTKNSAKTRT